MKPKNLLRLASTLPGLLVVLAGCGPYGGPPDPEGARMVTPTTVAPWRFGDVRGRRIATAHYHIYTTAENRGLLEYLPGFMEAAHDHYLRLTGLAARDEQARPMPVYMFADRRQWAVMTERITRPNQELYLGIENGGYCFRGTCVFWDMQHLATLSVASHEGLHQFFHHRLREHIPAWAEEGLCVLAEGFMVQGSLVHFDPEANPMRLLDLRRAISGGRRMALSDLLSSDAGDHIRGSQARGPEYYGQLWALLRFIRSRSTYRAGLERMLRDAADGRLRQALNVPRLMGAGRSYNRAVSVPMFKHYIDADLPGFEARFRSYAKSLAKLP